jgi:hypothetical protein
VSKYDLIRATIDVLEVAENERMAKTNKERQDDYRARQALLNGAKEVRGIYLPEELHAELKAYAKKLAKQHKPEEKK